jgi:hypothetical protein
LIAIMPAYSHDGEDAEPTHHGVLERFHPAGGWHPYGGGLFHWWNPHCFPCQVAPDDYCRKPLPRMCWGAYPSYYGWGTPEVVSKSPAKPH